MQDLTKLRVFLVVPHPLFRAFLKEELQRRLDIEIVGDAEDGFQAFVLAQQLMPDIVIMDVRLPDMRGVDATTVLRHHLPDTRVVLLGSEDDQVYRCEALTHGASAYLAKQACVQELLSTLTSVHQSSRYRAALPRVGTLEL